MSRNMCGGSRGTGVYHLFIIVNNCHNKIHFGPRYRGADIPGSDERNRHGYGNSRPSFWAATGYSEPWVFSRKDPAGFKMFVETLPSLETGTVGEQVVFKEWSHLLKRLPTKEDRAMGKISTEP